LLLFVCNPRSQAAVTITSPDGNVEAVVSVNASNQLEYTLARNGGIVLEPSALGITVDNVTLGSSVVAVSGSASTTVNLTYPFRGAKAVAVNHYNEKTLTVTRSGTGDSSFQMIWRAYNDGIGYRYIIPGSGSRTIYGEASSWNWPTGCVAWFQPLQTYYEKIFDSAPVGSFFSAAAMPTLIDLPSTGGVAGGYAAVMEAALFDYPGAYLVPFGTSTTFQTYMEGGTWAKSGGTVTPWRVTMVGADLNALVNSSLVWNLSDAPSAELASADWIRPGRSVWSWWAKRDVNWDARVQDQIPYIDAAVQLGFDYTVWDEGWGNWDTSDFDMLLEYARDQEIDVWLWVRWDSMQTAQQRTTFFDWLDSKNAQMGDKVIVGLKVDFMNSEALVRIQWYEAILQDAADRELMLNFHGANKPAGMDRTFPNEMTREAVRGLEYALWDTLYVRHNAILPFTRMLSGHADYTPCTFDPTRLGETTYAHQLAMAFLIVSPVTHWADDPQNYLNSVAFPVIQSAPTVWDETIVLDETDLGKTAAMARRSGNDWFVAVVNGEPSQAKSLSIDLPFLDSGVVYTSELLGDVPGNPAAFDHHQSSVTSNDSLNFTMQGGGGYVAALFKDQPPPVDFDDDGDVDVQDFSHLQVCLSGPGIPQTSPVCQDTLLDPDNDVDQDDVIIFLNCISGPNVQADAGCLP
jgi:alpha-glucosidase